MKSSSFFSLFLLITFSAAAQWEPAKQVFESPKLKSEVAKHKTVAIIPFEVLFKYRKQPKNYSADANREQEKSMAVSIQQSLFSYLLKNDYHVTFQDVEKTNTLLRKAGAIDSIGKYTKDELAKILGVDAILGGKFQTEQTASEVGAIATSLAFGMKGKTGTGTLFLALNNGSDGELLWRFSKTMDDTLFGSTDNLISRMMRKVARNFPYGD